MGGVVFLSDFSSTSRSGQRRPLRRCKGVRKAEAAASLLDQAGVCSAEAFSAAQTWATGTTARQASVRHNQVTFGFPPFRSLLFLTRMGDAMNKRTGHLR